MTRRDLIDAFNMLAEAAAKVAIELEASEQPQPPVNGAVDAGAEEPPSPSPRPAPRQESAFTRCPAHHKEWTEGKYGPYCTGQEPEGVPHDSDWYNDRGYCRVTPKSAGAWLKKHPRAA